MKNDNFKIDFAGIGAPRCATTWIYECLEEHPEVELLPKDQEETAVFFNEKEKDSELEFKQEDTLKGDYQVYYLSRGQEVVNRMKQHNPEMKFIVSLRDPIDRAYSQYKHTKFVENRDWESIQEGIEEIPEKIVEPGFYHKHLQRYFEVFPKKNFLVLLFEKDIHQNPVKTVRKIYQFLGVDQEFTPQVAEVKINPSGFKRSLMGRIIHKRITPLLKKFWLGKKMKENSFLKKIYYGLTGDLNWEREISKREEDYLKEIYHQDSKKLKQLIDKDLNNWKSLK